MYEYTHEWYITVIIIETFVLEKRDNILIPAWHILSFMRHQIPI